MSRIAALLLVVAALASVAAGTASGRSTAWRTHRAANGTFTVATPKSWTDFTRTTPEALKAAEANPSLRPYLRVVRSQKAMKLFLADVDSPTLERSFATNLNVLQLPTSAKLEQLREVEVAQLENAHVLVGRLSVSYVTLPAGRALSLAYQARFGSTMPAVAITQFILTHEGVENVITFTTLPSASAHYRTTFAASARSFRFS